jgi:hypothetical protein
MALGSTQFLTDMSTRNLPGGGKGRRTCAKADNLTAICEPTVWKMWKPRRLTTLWASTACYKDSFTYLLCLFLMRAKGSNQNRLPLHRAIAHFHFKFPRIHRVRNPVCRVALCANWTLLRLFHVYLIYHWRLQLSCNSNIHVTVKTTGIVTSAETGDST